MLEFLMNLDLATMSFFHLWRLNHSFVKFFNGHFFATWFMESQLYLPVRAFAQIDAFKLEFFKLHICQHLFILVSLTSDTQRTSLDEGCRLFDSFDFLRIQRSYYTAAKSIFAPGALILMPHLPVLIQAVMRAVDERAYLLLWCGLHLAIDDVSHVCRAPLTGEKCHIGVLA